MLVTIRGLLILVVAANFIACGVDANPPEEKDDNKTGTGTSTGAGATQDDDGDNDDAGTVTEQSGDLEVTQAATNFGLAADNLIPASLAENTTNLFLLESEDPCSGTITDPIGCRVDQAKHYLSETKQLLEQVEASLGDAGTFLTVLGVEYNSTQTGPASFEIGALIRSLLPQRLKNSDGEYLATDSDAYEILFVNDTDNDDQTPADPYFYLKATDDEDEMRGYQTYYHARVDGVNAEVENASADTNGIVDLYYTDTNNFELEVAVTAIPCQNDFVSVPESFYVTVKVVNGVWTGKIMTYIPRLNAADCATTVDHDVTSAAIYIDLVANAEKGSGAFYVIPSGLESTADLSTYFLGAVCTNFPHFCNGTGAEQKVLGTEQANLLSNFGNYLCVDGETVTWSNTAACADEGLTISNFGAATLWQTPKSLRDDVKLKEVPASL